MIVLMIVRDTLYQSPGGDTTQIEMTASYLRTLGVEVDIKRTSDSIEYSRYDLIHFFNIIRPDDILPHIGYGVPYVVSTIYVDYSEFEKLHRTGVAGILFKLLGSSQIEYIKAVARWIVNGDKIKSGYYLLRGHSVSVRRIVKGAKILLPNSNSEYIRFSRDFSISSSFQKVVNAIDARLFDINKITPDTAYTDHILCVGRIEGRKNQLNLIKAVKGSGLKLTIIGKSSPNHIEYYQECLKEASSDSNIQFIDHLSHAELVAVYRAARVHVLPSWFETTGLSTLEAAVMGCNVVITRKGDTEEYFGDMAFYCEPDNVDSIRSAVQQAFHTSGDGKLQNFIFENYTWENAARQTLQAYNEVIEVQSIEI